MSWDSYFDETSPNQYRFLGFYKHRQNQQNFTFSFRKEADILRKSLDLLIKDNRSEDIKKGATRLIQGFEKHRFHNEDVNNFWNEIESMCNNNEEQRLESERTLRTKRCHVDISSKTQRMMENIAEETVEVTKKRSTRKRKSIRYRENSEEEDHSSDPDYIEKPKRKQELRKRSRRKASDGMDKDVVVPLVETSEALEDTTSHEITPGTSQQSSTPPEISEFLTPEISEDISTSRENTPCPNYPIDPTDTIRYYFYFARYTTYSPYLICAFNATINYIKETIEEGIYTEIKNLLQAKGRLILQETLIKKLDTIFETKYTEIESKINLETVINGDIYTEEARFNCFIRDALIDFVANFRYRIPRVLDREISERTYIVESLSPIFRAFRNAFPDIKYDWIEKNVASIKEANNMFAEDINPRKTDLLVIRLSDGLEIMNTEVSGPPFKVTREHTVGDAKKLLMMSVCSLCRTLGNNLDCSVEIAKEIKTYSIQIIGDRLTLFSVSLIDKEKFLAVEPVSCLIPFSFDAIHYYTKIFNFFMRIRTEFVNQEKLRRKMYSSAPVDNSVKVRDWLLLPDDYFFYDLKPLPEDIDEIIVI
ncbi:hypothetical protein RhiirC2_869571 [Rhizophagus irregularis]|uniref:Uncharacterized protein n=1 Tax=Rhizophagus irregularis TaxID=588596 RepID=A0A2N1MQF1_9GLOM|nr:hypothetical protein RhiirC2_869571 [Rhizophagus irregularis]